MNTKTFKKTVVIIAILLGSTTVAFGLTQSEKGRLSIAGMCTAVADEENKILRSDGNSGSFEPLKSAASKDIQSLRSLPGAIKTYDDFYQATIDGMKDYTPEAKRVVIVQLIAECVKEYQVQ